MEKIVHEMMVIMRLFLVLILAISYIPGSDGQKLTTEELTTLLNQKEIPVREPSHFAFPKDRKPSLVSTRIIGGNVTTPNEYPFQVALYIMVHITQYFCGGSLITPEFVLTAAHCVEDATSITVVLGAHDISQTESSQIAYKTTTYIMHEAWDSTLLQNDVALIRLPENVTLSSVIGTVEMAQGTDTYAGIMSKCLGWGITILGTISNALRYVDAEVITNDACSSSDEDYEAYIVDHHLCTSGEGFVGSCNGDSGGPLLINGTQVGIVSFGAVNCSAGLPSVYTRVTNFHSWVIDKLENWNVEVNSTETPGGAGTSTGPLLGVCIGMILSVLFFNF